ncbi:hypothetical protein ILYODFUR_032427 [Ilyodon furcidens]|uniref:Uncharacterized protein n=1 Tax=Ilyodon furcidens TaxID=33524 RepID=A0ABV0TSR7_9TELE
MARKGLGTPGLDNHFPHAVICCWLFAGPKRKKELGSRMVPLELEGRGCDRCTASHHQLGTIRGRTVALLCLSVFAFTASTTWPVSS